MVNLIFPIIALIIAISLIVYFIKNLLRSFNFDLNNFRTKLLLSKKKPLIDSIDRNIKENKHDGLATLFKESFVLSDFLIRSKSEDKIYKHNLTLIQKLYLLAKSDLVQTPDVDLLNELLHTRENLLEEYSSNKDSFLTFKSRRNLRGATTPAWVLEGFKKNEIDFKNKIKVNTHAFQQQLKKIFNNFNSTQSSNDNSEERIIH